MDNNVVYSDGEVASALILMLVICAVYFIPFFVAMGKDHKDSLPIGILNFFLGWTFVGWVIALIWAVKKPNEPTKQQIRSNG